MLICLTRLRMMEQLLRTMIGKHTDISCLPTCFKYNLTNYTDQIFNTFCNFFTDIDPNYVKAIPVAKKQFIRYLQKSPAKNLRSMFMNPTHVNEINQMIWSLLNEASTLM